MGRLSQNVQLAATGGIGITTAPGNLTGGANGLIKTLLRLGTIATHGRNGTYGAALARVAHGHRAATVTPKALHRDGSVGLYANIHESSLEVLPPCWQAGRRR